MTFLSATDLRGHALLEACGEILSRIQRAIRDLQAGADGASVSDMRVRRLGVRECNGRALI